MTYKKHTHCRVCQSQEMTPYLDLGVLPLSNNLCQTASEAPKQYPLVVMFCEECGLSQLSIVVDPQILFGHYVYRSSISQGYKDHCLDMARSLKDQYGLGVDSFHIDIAGNDGALLSEFKKVVNGLMLNVDPAMNLVPLNKDQGIRQFTAFWGIDAANHLRNTLWPKADLITATNVFAHVDSMKGFLLACKIVMKETGVIILEFPYLLNFIENNEFDTVYFEHLSYVMISPLKRLCESIGLTIMDVEEFDIHGGSVRVHIGYGAEEKSVAKFVENEQPYMCIDPYIKFAASAKRSIRMFKENIREGQRLGLRFAGFAASAKGSTLMNCAEIDNRHIEYIVDETPEKIGKYSPGTAIEIVPMVHLIENEPDYLIVLSWNFFDAIKEKCRAAGYRGKFVIPIPEWRVVE